LGVLLKSIDEALMVLTDGVSLIALWGILAPGVLKFLKNVGPAVEGLN
jgi:hypothetical protein